MGTRTEIYWTDSTFNGWWGCNEVSDGCDHCYARTLSERWHRAAWGDPRETLRWVTSDANWHQPLLWNRRAEAGDTNTVRGGARRLVFAHSMSDVFEHAAQLDPLRDRLWQLIEETPMLDWLLLTKRPQNIRRMLPQTWLQQPRPNVWLGTSAEDDDWLERRAYHLLQVPAVVHFVSAEPLFGPLSLHRFLPKINWVITGGESGPHHRALDPVWVEDIDAQCQTWGVAHFFKQHGGRTHAEGGCLLRGVEVKEFPTPRMLRPMPQVAA